MNQEPMTKKLAVKLSDEEVATKSFQLANVYREVLETEARAKEAAKGFADKVKKAKERLRELAANVTTRTEERDVVCSERLDARRFVVETIRHDTGEVIEVRALNEDETEGLRQTHLFGPTVIDAPPNTPTTGEPPPEDVSAATGPGEGDDDEEPEPNGTDITQPAELAQAAANAPEDPDGPH